MRASQASARLLSGSIQIASSAFATFGVESEEVSKALLKVQAAAQLAGGIKDLSRGIGGLSSVFGVARTAAASFNATLLANPVILITAAIAALVVGIVALSGGFDDASDSQKDFIDEVGNGSEVVNFAEQQVKKFNDALFELGLSQKKVTIEIDATIEKLKLQGASLETIAIKEKELEIQRGQELVKLREAYSKRLVELEKDLEFERFILRQQNEAGDKAAAEKALANIEKLKDERREANKELKSIQIDELKNKKELEIADLKIADARKKDAEKENERRKKQAQEELKILKEAEEAKIELTEEGSFTRLEAELSAIDIIEAFQVKFAKNLEISENGITIIKQKNIDKRKQLEDEYYKFVNKLEKSRVEVITISSLAAQTQAKDEEKIKKAGADAVAQIENATYFNKIKRYGEIKKAEQENIDFVKQLNNQLSTDLQTLNDAVFQYKTRNLEKGSKEEEKFAKRQFKINKALSLSSAIISGFLATLEAYKNGMKNPVPLLGPATAGVYAALAAISSGALIAKIASTKFDSSSFGTTPSTSAPSAPSLNTTGSISPQTFQPNTFGTGVSQQQTFGGSGVGGGNVMRAYVTESDITSTNLRLNSIRNASEL